MSIRRHIHLRVVLPALGVALAGVVGCSTLPTAPRVSTRASSMGATAFDRTARGLVAFDPLSSLAPDPKTCGLDTTKTPPDSIETIKFITGDDGGEVKAGRFEVDLPAGVFTGDASISVRVDQENALRCELGIFPASANGFRVPVLLKVDCSGARHVERMGIVWLNEATGEWEEVEGNIADPATGIVSAPLQHFSSYAVIELVREGKAGW